MTRIDFYFNVNNKQRMLFDVVEAALAKNRQVTIATEDEVIAGTLSAELWQAEPESFWPNVPANHTSATHTPVVIHWQNQAVIQDELLINLTQKEPSFFSRFTQLIELVTNDEQDKVAARARFKFYRDRGYEIKSIDCVQGKTE
jgi:DNA polymerase III subunit chi